MVSEAAGFSVFSVFSRFVSAPATALPTPAAGAAEVAARPAPKPASTMVCAGSIAAAAVNRRSTLMRRVCHPRLPGGSSHEITSHQMYATKHCFRLVLALLLSLPVFAAHHPTAIVQKKANLRHDPSAAKAAIMILLPDQEVEVLDTTKSPRYAKVRTEEPKKTGWVLKSAISILPPEPPPVVVTEPDYVLTA